MVGRVDGEEEEGGEGLTMMMMMMRKSLVLNAYRKYSLSQSILYLDEVELMCTHNQRRGSKHDIRHTVHHIAQRERMFSYLLLLHQFLYPSYGDAHCNGDAHSNC